MVIKIMLLVYHKGCQCPYIISPPPPYTHIQCLCPLYSVEGWHITTVEGIRRYEIKSQGFIRRGEAVSVEVEEACLQL